MAINKKDVRDIYDLQQYIQESTSKSRRLYHYTTYESLVCIIKNKCMRLSRMDLLNDKAEQKLGNSDEHLKNYILSFTRDKEYISMWAMYGKASGIKLRLDFPKNEFAQAINDNFYLDANKFNKIPLYSDHIPGNFSKKGFLLSDVVYLDKKTNRFRHSENDFINIQADKHKIEELTGLIKYDAWEFEREVRLRVLMRDDLSRDNQGYESVPQHIFAGINDELIRNFHITFNPWMSAEIKEEIKKSLNGLANYELEFNDSQHDGEIKDL